MPQTVKKESSFRSAMSGLANFGRKTISSTVHMCQKVVTTVAKGVSKAVTTVLSKLSTLGKDAFHSAFGEKYSDGITIKGTKEYREKVKKRLDELKKTSSGRQTLQALDKQGREGKGVTIVDTPPGNNHCKIIGDPVNARPKAATLNKKTGRVDVLQAGQGTKSQVGFNPDYEPKYPDGKSCRSPAIALGHELLHAKHNGEGKNLNKFSDPTDPGTVNPSNHEEAQTIGRGAYAGDKPTDNSMRKETGTKERTSHGSVCP